MCGVPFSYQNHEFIPAIWCHIQLHLHKPISTNLDLATSNIADGQVDLEEDDGKWKG